MENKTEFAGYWKVGLDEKDNPSNKPLAMYLSRLEKRSFVTFLAPSILFFVQNEEKCVEIEILFGHIAQLIGEGLTDMNNLGMFLCKQSSLFKDQVLYFRKFLLLHFQKL